MREVILRKSTNPKKKYDAYVEGKKVSFGATGDEERKQRYIDRHKKNENWSDTTTAGALSKHLLWKRPTLKESITATEKKFYLDIKYKKQILA